MHKRGGSNGVAAGCLTGVVVCIATVAAFAGAASPAAPASGPALATDSKPAEPGRVLRVRDDESLNRAVETAAAGDTIEVAPGHYAGFAFTRKFPEGRPLTIRSAERHKAVFDRGRTLYFRGVENVVLDGFELTGMQMEHRGANGLIHVEGESRSVTLRNLHVHGAGFNDDCIKVNLATNIDVLDCVLHDPGQREANNGPQETLDYYDVNGGRIAGNLFLGGTSRQYVNAKAGSRDIVIENNILLDHHGARGDEAIVLGGHSGTVRGDYEGVNITARNNLILRSRSGAFQVRNVKGAHIYNNLVYDCTRSPLIQAVPGRGKGQRGGSDGVHVSNNIFCNTDGRMPVLMQVAGELTGFDHRHNLYFNGGRPIPAGGCYDPNDEAGAVYSDPLLQIEIAPRYVTVYESLALSPKSPAIDAGIMPSVLPAGVFLDIHGMRRPQGRGVDIGPLEH